MKRSTKPLVNRRRLFLEALEDRLAPATFATGSNFGAPPLVSRFDSATAAPIDSFLAYDARFLGGVKVAQGNLTNSVDADVITGTGTGTSHVKVFDGATKAEVFSFLAFDGFTGGVDVAAGDVNADGTDDIIVIANGAVNGHVKVFDGTNGAEIRSFFSLPGNSSGVHVASGDINADGNDDIIVSGVVNDSALVNVFSGANGSLLHSFIPYPGFGPGFGGPVTLASGDVDGDGNDDVITGVAPISGVTDVGASAHVKVFSGATGAEIRSFFAFDPAFKGGVVVGFMSDQNGDGIGEIVAGSGPGPASDVRVLDGNSQAVLQFFATLGSGYTSGNLAPPANSPPEITSPATVAVNENTTAVQTVIATDPDGDTLAFSITGGADATLFTIDQTTGVLAFVAPPNFEVPTDSGTNNVYDVTVQVSDGSLTDTQAISITVTEANDNTPTITSDGGGATASVNAAENSTAVTTVTATDADAGTTLTFSIVGGADQTLFSIDGSTGVLTFNSAPDFEVPTDSGTDNVYDVTVQVSDGSLSDTQAISVSVTDVNDNTPTITSDGGGATASVNVAENSTAVTTVTATDADAGTTLTFSIVGGADQTLFSIDGSTGVLTFNSAPDFEVPTDSGTNNVYNVTVQVSDGSLTDTQAISVSVTGVNEAPTITSDGGGAAASLNAAENSTAVTTVTATDADAGTTLTFSIVGGADQTLFSIDGSTGVLTFNSAPDFEVPTDSGTNNVYDVTVQVSDGSLTDTQAISITVTDANDAPTITSNGGGAAASLNAAENSTAVTTVTATDADAGTTLTFSIVGGADQTLFSIDGSTGVLTFNSAPDFEVPTDSGTNNVYNVTVQVSDGSLTDTQAISVSVTGVNDNTPTITSNGGGATASVNAADNSTAVTTVTATDADAGTTLTFSIVGGADQTLFSIDGSTGVLTFNSAPDFEVPTDSGTNNVYDVTVQVSDGSLTDTQAISITVTDANDAPVVTTSSGNTPYTVGGAPSIIDAAITVTDVDSGDMMVGATVGSDGFVDGDVLTFDSALALGFGISGSYSGGPSGTGILTLTGSATPGQYQAVLQTVAFSTTVNISVNITFTFTVDDGLATDSATKVVAVTSM